MNRFILFSLLISVFTGSAKAQVFSGESAHTKSDPIEVGKREAIRELFTDRRFASGYLLYMSFYHEFPFASVPNSQQGESYKPEVGKKLLQYYIGQINALNSDVASAYYDRANARIDSSLYEQAMGDFDQVLMYQPLNADAFVGRAVLFIISEQFSDALAELEKARKLAPRNPEVFFNIGVVSFNQGNPDLALKQLDRALAIDPTHSRSHFEKGLVLSSIGQVDNAMQELRWARNLGDPDAGKALRDLKQQQKEKKK